MATEKEVKKVTKKKRVKRSPKKKEVVVENTKAPVAVFEKITKIVTQFCIGIVAIVMVFAPDSAWVLGPIIGSLAIMGIALGYFASK